MPQATSHKVLARLACWMCWMEKFCCMSFVGTMSNIDEDPERGNCT